MPSQPETKRVSLVFVTTDEGHFLIPALESFHAGHDARSFEIVVVDNASNDGTDKAIAERWPEVKVLRNSRRLGLPANLNRGILESNGKHVMLCNSDLIFETGSVDTLADFLDSHPRAAMAAPSLVGPDGKHRTSARRWYTLGALVALKGPWSRFLGNTRLLSESVYGDWDMSAPRIVDWVPCPATMVRREAFDDVGLMDERFRLYFDDVDISLRMHEAGWEVWCVPESRIVHIEQRSSVRPLSRAWRWHLVSLIKFWWKHKSLRPKTGRPQES